MHGVKIENLVDLGCADGSITFEIAKYLDIDHSNVVGIDIRDIRKTPIGYN